MAPCGESLTDGAHYLIDQQRMTRVRKVYMAETLKYLELNLLGMMFRQVMIMFYDIVRLNQLIVHRDV
jgi:hypothetical protein